MCAGITLTQRYVPHSQQTNIAGWKIEAHKVVTMETSSAFLRSQEDFQMDCFLKEGLTKYDGSAG